MTTVRQLITSALKKINVIGASEVPTADDMQDGFEALNQMIDYWSTDGAMIYNEVIETFTLPNTTGAYTIGPSGDFNTVRPITIRSASIVSDTIEYPLSIDDMENYALITDKNLTGIPSYAYFDSNFPLMTVRLYALPSTTYQFKLYSEKPLTQFASIDEVVSLPSGTEQTIIHNLAIIRAPDYEKQAPQSVSYFAQNGLNNIKRQNRQNKFNEAAIDPALRNLGGFNIFSGDYQR